MVSPKDSSNQPTPKSGYSPGSPSGSTDPNPSSPSLYSPCEAIHHNSQAENDPRVQQKSDISVANYDRPPKMVEQSKKSRWWLAPAGFVVAVAVGFAGAQFRDVLVEDSTPLAATDTDTLTTQVVSTTIEPTTTLAPTTTVAETTTTLPNYEGRSWDC